MKIGCCERLYRQTLLLLVFCPLLMMAAPHVTAQTALIEDAWWTFQQDADGDGLFAGIMASNAARLNWNPDVLDCNGTLTVKEIIYYKPASGSTWTPLHTNASHSITGCRSSDGQHYDIALATVAATNDYKIEIYRIGHATPDFVRSGTNDVELAAHGEEALANDFSQSDNFATSTVLSGSLGNISEHNVTASKEPGEPNHAGNVGGKSLWYSWTANENTSVTFETVGSGFDTLLAVYTGSSVNALSLIASNDDIAGSTNRQSRVTFTPVAGTTYRIAVDGFGGASGLMTLSWVQTGGILPDLVFWGPAVSATILTKTFAPDDCEVVEGCGIVGTRTLLSFTTETRNIGGGDLVMGDPATNSLFHYASCHGHYHFEEFAIYDLLDGNGDAVASGHKVGFCLLDDHAYSTAANPQPKYDCGFQGIQSGWADVYAAGLPCQYIDITGVPPGEYVLRLEVNPAGLLPESNTNNNVTLVPISIPQTTCTNLPPNDDFATPLVVTATPFSEIEFNNCATKQGGEPDHADSTGGHSLWYSWTPTVTHNALITTKRSDYDTVLAVYTGNNIASLTLIGSSDDITGEYGNLQSEVFFTAQAGTTYRIVVDGFSNSVGTTVLNIDPPGNDDFDEPFLLVGTSGSTNGYNFGASKHVFEPAHAFDVGGHSIWYTWTAPTNGPVEFNTEGSTFNTTLAVYTGNHLFLNTLVAANNDDVGGPLISRLNFHADAGTTYEIAVDGFGGEVGDTVLNWTMDSHLSIASDENGVVHIGVDGVAWQRYVVLSSTNLTQWVTNQGPFTMTGAPWQFTNSVSLPFEFFHSRLLP